MFSCLLSMTGMFQVMSCEVLAVNYTQIVCETFCPLPPSACPVRPLYPQVLVPSGESSAVVGALCSGAGCTFIPSEEMTATVTGVVPSSIQTSRCYDLEKCVWYFVF